MKTIKPVTWTLEVSSYDDGLGYAPCRRAEVRASDGHYVIGMEGRMDDEQGNADLALISVAPEMLAVLKKAYSAYCGSVEIEREIRAVIAKAQRGNK